MFPKPLIPVFAAAALYAQQAPDPSPAEKALRERVTQFYQLQVEKKFRQAEAFIAADTKDLFYASAKPEISNIGIVSVSMKDATHAQVTVKATVNMLMMGSGLTPIELPTTGSWKIEDGQWVWYVDQSAAPKSPFGDLKPPAETSPNAPPADIAEKIKSFNPDSLRGQVSISPQSISLSADQPVQFATVKNNMPGEVNLSLMTKAFPSIGIELEKGILKAGDTAKVTFTRKGSDKSSGNARVDVAPLNLSLLVEVKTQ